MWNTTRYSASSSNLLHPPEDDHPSTSHHSTPAKQAPPPPHPPRMEDALSAWAREHAVAADILGLGLVATVVATVTLLLALTANGMRFWLPVAWGVYGLGAACVAASAACYYCKKHHWAPTLQALLRGEVGASRYCGVQEAAPSTPTRELHIRFISGSQVTLTRRSSAVSAIEDTAL